MANHQTDRWVPELTSVRAFAAWAICITHAAFWTGGYTDDLAGRIAARFEIGVTVFFVLSGFLLFRPWVAALSDGPRPNLRRYARHRITRILPGYWITVLVVYALDIWPRGGAEHIAAEKASADVPGTGLEGLLRTMTFWQSAEFGWFHPGLSQMWSLVVEVGFYLVLPLVGMAVWWLCRGQWRPVRAALIVVAFGLVSPLWLWAVHACDSLEMIALLWPPGYFDWFAAGMLMAIGSRCGWQVPAWVGWPIAAVFAALAVTPIAGPATLVPADLSTVLAKNVVYLLLGVAIMAPVMLGGISWLRHPVLVWLGENSYEFFLVHLIVMEYVMPLLGYPLFTGSMWLVLVVTTAVAVPVAWGLRVLTDAITGRN
ncbi:acyltransferase [Corynebacterium sp. TAE3-ERU12]|uniref:acyltransferase family protein n=1 Tax=Corynebacterium sp. TAE3-ERU12 TaxID=2849491 RepID=UPI001C45B7C5|nr:acyltransferase [Corynebacterium sp. TAE3-ERU12]